jgi:hypothetical protein
VVLAAKAATAESARQHGFNCNTITYIDPPPRRCAVSYPGYSPQWLVPGNERQIHTDDAFVLFDITTANTTGLKFQNGRILINIRDKNIPWFELASAGLDHCK